MIIVQLLYTFYTIMEFEFDLNKSASNKEKHGIDFRDAQLLWQDPDRIVIPASNLDEPRFLIIGKIGEDLWLQFARFEMKEFD